MPFTRRPVLWAAFVLAAATVCAAQAPSVPSHTDLTPSEMEAFLLKGRIQRMGDAGAGVTNSRRARLSNGTITHDVHVQFVDLARPVLQAGRRSEVNFKDLYRFNIAAFRLARLIGLDNVPMSVERVIEGKRAAVTWWVDDVVMDEKERLNDKPPDPAPLRTQRQLQVMRIFDELIQNTDRNQGNILWTRDWTLWMIDHTRAFRLGNALINPDHLARCERALLEQLRGLTRESVTQAVRRSLDTFEIRALLARRDRIVAHFDERIASRGDGEVLFELTP